MPGVAFIIPTRDRPNELARALGAIGSLDHAAGPLDAEVVIADNCSSRAVAAPVILDNGIRVRVIRLKENAGAAARNIAASKTEAPWLVMLDDDSYPADSGVFDAIAGAPVDVAAIGAEIHLISGQREAGGLPEVFVGCGVAIRAEAFGGAGGYDPTFQYYAEEYDLAARLLLDGWRVTHDRRFRVNHEKSVTQRNMDHICRRLVRNNAWVAARYAPRVQRRTAISRDVARYARIAIRENAMDGYGAGFAEMCLTLHRQTRNPMPVETWDRFVGLTAVREAFGASEILRGRPMLYVVDRGKNGWVLDQVIREFGLATTADPGCADAVVIGTCSPGPMLDSAERWAAMGFTVIEPWRFDAPAPAVSTPDRRALTLAS